MNELYFNFYGVNLLISDLSNKHQKILEYLEEDFRYFLNSRPNSQENLEITIRIIEHSDIKEKEEKLSRIFTTRLFEVYGLNSKRICKTNNKTSVFYQRSKLNWYFEISGTDQLEIYESAYITMLSSVGEALDLVGYHRIHALGIHYADRKILMIAPSGGGKSTLAAKLMSHPSIKIYSDEMPLLKDGVIYPFPIRIALFPEVACKLYSNPENLRTFKRKLYREKLLVPITEDKIAAPGKLQIVCISYKIKKFPSQILPRSLIIYTELFKSLVLGLGLCQIAEFMLRGDNIIFILRIMISRLIESIKVFRNCYNNSHSIEEHFGAMDTISLSDIPTTSG